jgi:hypothetical protein
MQTFRPMNVYGYAMLESKRTAKSRDRANGVSPAEKREEWKGPRARGPLTFPIVPPSLRAVAPKPLGYEPTEDRVPYNDFERHPRLVSC